MRLAATVIAVIIAASAATADDFTCPVEHVTDGDTFRCEDGTRIRIHGIDAPEMDTAEGPISRDALQALIGGSILVCDQKGNSYNRKVATCYLDGEDIAAAMVKRGMARDCERYSGGAYDQLETQANAALPIGSFCRP